MKNRIGMGSCFTIAGILLAAGPASLFAVCTPGEQMMKCWWSGRAEIGIGILLAAVGIIYFLAASVESKGALSVVAIAAFFVAVLIPAVLIGGCTNPEMTCRAVTFPCIYAISIIGMLAALGNILYLRKSRRTE